jgi:hypothetical protein
MSDAARKHKKLEQKQAVQHTVDIYKNIQKKLDEDTDEEDEDISTLINEINSSDTDEVVQISSRKGKEQYIDVKSNIVFTKTRTMLGYFILTKKEVDIRDVPDIENIGVETKLKRFKKSRTYKTPVYRILPLTKEEVTYGEEIGLRKTSSTAVDANPITVRVNPQYKVHKQTWLLFNNTGYVVGGYGRSGKHIYPVALNDYDIINIERYGFIVHPDAVKRDPYVILYDNLDLETKPFPKKYKLDAYTLHEPTNLVIYKKKDILGFFDFIEKDEDNKVYVVKVLDDVEAQKYTIIKSSVYKPTSDENKIDIELREVPLRKKIYSYTGKKLKLPSSDDISEDATFNEEYKKSVQFKRKLLHRELLEKERIEIKKAVETKVLTDKKKELISELIRIKKYEPTRRREEKIYKETKDILYHQYKPFIGKYNYTDLSYVNNPLLVTQDMKDINTKEAFKIIDSLKPEVSEIVTKIRKVVQDYIIETLAVLEDNKTNNVIFKDKKRLSLKIENEAYDRSKSMVEYVYLILRVVLLLNERTNIGKRARYFQQHFSAGDYNNKTLLDLKVQDIFPELYYSLPDEKRALLDDKYNTLVHKAARNALFDIYHHIKEYNLSIPQLSSINILIDKQSYIDKLPDKCNERDLFIFVDNKGKPICLNVNDILQHTIPSNLSNNQTKQIRWFQERLNSRKQIKKEDNVSIWEERAKDEITYTEEKKFDYDAYKQSILNEEIVRGDPDDNAYSSNIIFVRTTAREYISQTLSSLRLAKVDPSLYSNEEKKVMLNKSSTLTFKEREIYSRLGLPYNNVFFSDIEALSYKIEKGLFDRHKDSFIEHYLIELMYVLFLLNPITNLGKRTIYFQRHFSVGDYNASSLFHLKLKDMFPELYYSLTEEEKEHIQEDYKQKIKELVNNNVIKDILARKGLYKSITSPFSIIINIGESRIQNNWICEAKDSYIYFDGKINCILPFKMVENESSLFGSGKDLVEYNNYEIDYSRLKGNLPDSFISDIESKYSNRILQVNYDYNDKYAIWIKEEVELAKKEDIVPGRATAFDIIYFDLLKMRETYAKQNRINVVVGDQLCTVDVKEKRKLIKKHYTKLKDTSFTCGYCKKLTAQLPYKSAIKNEVGTIKFCSMKCFEKEPFVIAKKSGLLSRREAVHFLGPDFKHEVIQILQEHPSIKDISETDLLNELENLDVKEEKKELKIPPYLKLQQLCKKKTNYRRYLNLREREDTLTSNERDEMNEIKEKYEDCVKEEKAKFECKRYFNTDRIEHLSNKPNLNLDEIDELSRLNKEFDTCVKVKKSQMKVKIGEDVDVHYQPRKIGDREKKEPQVKYLKSSQIKYFKKPPSYWQLVDESDQVTSDEKGFDVEKEEPDEEEEVSIEVEQKKSDEEEELIEI